MAKEEAKKMLGERQHQLRQAEILLEMHENGVRELREGIERLEAIINKKDDWRDKLIQPNSSAYFYIGYGVEGVTTYADRNTDRKPEYAFRKPSHAQLLADKIQLMQEMHAFAHVKNEGWVLDWKDDFSLRWGLTMDSFEGVSLNAYFSHNAFVFGIAVKSKEIAEEMLKEFGERIEEIYNKQY